MASFREHGYSQPRPSPRYDSSFHSRDHDYHHDYSRQPVPRHYHRHDSYDYHDRSGQHEFRDDRRHKPMPSMIPSLPDSPSSSWQSDSWPPQPFVEDEAASLQGEADSQLLLEEIGKDEVTNRGAVDQEPIIADIDNSKSSDDRPAQSMPAPKKDTPRTSGIPTPPTSEDERDRRSRRRPSRLNVGNAAYVPEVSKRTSSPYAHTYPNRLSRELAYNDNMTPPPSETHSRGAWMDRPEPGTPRRDSARFGPNSRQDYFNADETAIDDTELMQSAVSSGRTSIVDFAPPPANFAPLRRPNLDARRNTDVPSTLPNMLKLNVDKPQRMGALLTPDAMTESPAAYSASLKPTSMESYPRSRESSYSSSRGVSPGSIPGQRLSNEPQSQRSSWDSQAASLAGYRSDSRPGSRQGSCPGSAASSRPTTPTTMNTPRTPLESPRMLKVDMDWSAITNAARRPQRTSRLSSSTIPDSLSYSPHDPPSSTTPFRSASNLPYPEHDGMMSPGFLMPAEQEHQYFGGHVPSVSPLPPQSAREAGSFVGPPSPAPSAASFRAEKPKRPTLMREYSTASISPTETRAADGRSRNRGSGSGIYAISSQMKKEISSLRNRDPPNCKQPERNAGTDDWYTVKGNSCLDICSDCVDSVFERTFYRPLLRRSLPRNYNTKVRCAFGSRWSKYAWARTLEQRRVDFALLEDVAQIESTTEPCPGHKDSDRGWYGLKDPKGNFIENFRICTTDVRKIERLLPTLFGVFVPLPPRLGPPNGHVCAFREDSPRFHTYLEALTSAHDKAVASHKDSADLVPYLEIVLRKPPLRPCTKEAVVRNGLWHTVPSAPALTVCEECFHSVVEPEIRKDSRPEVAVMFNRFPQPVYGADGASCQLYSRFMRKVFSQAAKHDEPDRLMRKAKERWGDQLRMKDQCDEVDRRAKRLQREGRWGPDEHRRLDREISRLKEDWKMEWE